jgi:two-component system, OmpR family, KDP operon response regulator KdpE
MTDKTQILLIEDDRNIIDLVRLNLVQRHFEVVVSDGQDALRLVDVEQPDIVLLDLTLPGAGLDGVELCRRIRERSQVGIIVVSARHGEQDKVSALEFGADDYMTKPFGIRELLARITATLRRTRPGPRPAYEEVEITVDDVVIHLSAQRVTKADQLVRLTPTEFALLREFVTNRGKLLTHAMLLRRVWGPGYETQTEYTRTYVRRLRAKLESPDGPQLIITEPRAGYRFVTG